MRAEGQIINIMIDDIFTGLYRPCWTLRREANQQITEIGRFCRFTAHTLRMEQPFPYRGTGWFCSHAQNMVTPFKVIFEIHV